MPDQTFEELLPQCAELLSNGHTFWAKFTCQHCGARQTSDQKNVFHKSYICEECGGLSTPERYGLLIMMEAH
jgi:predicted RNA-binding Zn-ribbon protein involved in translation (DUF1610 family)